MSAGSDLEDTKTNSTISSGIVEDLEVQLHGLIHHATDSLDGVVTENISTEISKSHNQQDSVNNDQVSSFSVQNPSETVNVSSDHKKATEQNAPLCTIKPKFLKSSSKKPEKVIDYLALLKEYKTTKAQQNFAEMSRNPSLLWVHKQQDLNRGYRKRYWMTETGDQSDTAAINHNSDPPFHTPTTSTPKNAEAFVTQQFNGCTFQDLGVTECDGSSASKKLRNSLDTVTNHIHHNGDNYQKKKKKQKKKQKRKQRNSIQNANIDVSRRVEIPNRSKSAKVPKHQTKGEQQVIQENIKNHNFDKNINDIDSRYAIVPSKKEEDDVIVIDSSDSESSIVVLGPPPTPEPPPVVCLDSDNENLRHQQESGTVQLMLNVTAPKQAFRETIQGNEMIKGNLTRSSSSASKAASSSTSQVTIKGKRHRGVNDCRKWTAEMKSYYNESWGGEHFDVRILQRQMSNNPVNWHVSQRDWQLSLYQQRRLDKCTNCNEFGHPNSQCPRPAKPLCCVMCGQQGHTEPRCPNPICLKCGEKTAVYVRSCRNCKNKSCCTVCNKNGHSHDICPEVWRKYSTTTSTAQGPHAPVYKPKEEQWCCVCARKGHFPEDCQSFYVDPMTFQENKIETPKEKRKNKKKYYMQLQKSKVNFGMPC